AATGAAPRSPAPSRPSSAGEVDERLAGARGATGPAAGASGPKYFKQERSPARATVLVVGGVIVVVLALVFAVSALKGGTGSRSTSTPTQTASSETPVSQTKTSTQAAASNPAETVVAVLNGTGTAGLAHHLASDLQQSGYSKAAASAAVPPGTHATTVVEYTHGHRVDAQAVARALNVTQVQPIASSTSALAGPATVVVLAGADQAALLGGGSPQSQGEPAAGSSESATG
ncbi:MAG TPA: LytR C-terminal domain-containing protein, partial [Solirubrobacteraceae bacterium]